VDDGFDHEFISDLQLVDQIDSSSFAPDDVYQEPIIIVRPACGLVFISLNLLKKAAAYSCVPCPNLV